MRIAVWVAASVVLTGCSQWVVGDAERASPEMTTPPASTAPTTSTPTTTPSAPPSAAPASGAPIGEVVRWIEAGLPADPNGFHTAVRDGQTTQLGADTAFTTPAGPSGVSNCMTDSRADGALACLIDLAEPPPQPAEVYGEWKGGWVDFPGAVLDIGSAHGDPGRFSSGTGAELPFGQALAFGDYRCRSDPAGLFCVNYAHRSAVRFSTAGIDAFGCLQPVSPPGDIGARFSC